MMISTISEPVVLPSQEPSSSANPSSTTNKSCGTPIEIESAKCECCGLTEECTLAYIDRIRERYAGKWICGLCAEAVKDEKVRSERLISTEEALARHLNVCRNFRSSWPPATDPTVHLISAVRQILRRSFDSGPRSAPVSPMRGGAGEGDMMDRPPLIRSESCFPTLSS